MLSLLNGPMKVLCTPVAYCLLRISSDPATVCHICGWKGHIYTSEMPILNINFTVSRLKWFRVRHPTSHVDGLAVVCKNRMG